MIKQTHQDLWNRILAFRIDNSNAIVTFSAKLAREQNWSADFTRLAIDEYKKFIFLCCISENGAAPSQIVDEVWHLHLTYTQSYWVDFCKNTLGRELHHNPSTGGDTEDKRHKNWYLETLDLYKETFGEEAPADIWPRPSMKLLPQIKKSSKVWIWIWIVAPFLQLIFVYHTVFPYFLTGPQFLGYYPFFAFSLIAIYIVQQKDITEQAKKIATDLFPYDASPFQMADFLHGKHRATQTALVDLIKKGLIELRADKTFVTTPYNLKWETNNPLVAELQKETPGSTFSYAQILTKWYNPKSFSHPVLTELSSFVPHRSSKVIYSFFFGVPIIRMIQGLINGRPIDFLMALFFMSTILFVIVGFMFSAKLDVQHKVADLYRERSDHKDQLLSSYALKGTSALAGFAEATLLTEIFPLIISEFGEKGHPSDGSSGSSCGSSSCGSSSCGGGGCGGCGGGGN
jgi:uncharacterized membrane protein YgcG